MRQRLKFFGLVFLFLFSFVFFFYVTFPTPVLKQAAVGALREQAGLELKVEDMSIHFPLGVSAYGVVLGSKAGAVGFKKINFYVQSWRLFLGRIVLQAEIIDDRGGILEGDVRIKLLDLIQGNFELAYLELSADKFSLQAPTAYALGQVSSQSQFGSLLSEMSVQGLLNGFIQMDMGAGDPQDWQGDMKLDIAKGKLVFKPTVGFPEQVFKTAGIQGVLEKGTLSFMKGSGFDASDVKLLMSGQIGFKSPMERSNMSLNIDLELDEQYAWIADAAAQRATRGKLSIQAKGSMFSPRVDFY
ncbi:MAG: type II secretion system protein GspN [Oligoflexales bacterium]